MWSGELTWQSPAASPGHAAVRISLGFHQPKRMCNTIAGPVTGCACKSKLKGADLLDSLQLICKQADLSWDCDGLSWDCDGRGRFSDWERLNSSSANSGEDQPYRRWGRSDLTAASNAARPPLPLKCLSAICAFQCLLLAITALLPPRLVCMVCLLAIRGMRTGANSCM